MAAQTPVVSQRIISQPTMMLTSLSSQSVDESIIREQVLSTHNYDGREFDTKFILSMAENSLSLETGTAQKVMVKELNQLEKLDTYKELSLHIRQLSLEIASAAIAKNQHFTIIHHVLRIVSPYCWEDKLVLMLGAFSIIHGESTLISPLLHKGKGLAGKLAHLKQSSSHHSPLSSAIQLTKCVLQLKQCLSYSPPQPLISALPMAAYWIATTLVNSASYAYGHPHFKVQNEHREITTLMATFSAELAKKEEEESYETLRNALYHGSSNKLEVFKLMFNVKDDEDIIFTPRWRGAALRNLKNRLVMLLITSGVGVPKEWILFLNWFRLISRAYIIWIPITQDDASWSTEYEQQCDKLRNKLNFFWLNDPQKMMRPQFTRFVKEELFKMRWGEEPIIVSLDQRGRIAHSNAIHMMLTWRRDYIEKDTIGVNVVPHNISLIIQNELKQGIYGIETSSESQHVGPKIDSMIRDLVRNIDSQINAWKKDVEGIIKEVTAQSTPYESEREKLLWQQQATWTLHLLATLSPYHFTIRTPINDWIRDEKYIFLYGGNNIKWIREFIFKVREVAFKTQMNFELAYIGKNKMIRGIINKERMSHCALDNSFGVWWFWARLRSMFLSRIQYLGMTNHLVKEYNNDEILQGLKKLLSYETKNATTEGWTLLSKGSEVIVCGHGSKMLQAMNDYEIWKENIHATKSFGQAFKDHHEMLSKDMHSCCTLEYPITLSKISENEKCPECSHRMQKFLTFTCCHDHDVDYDSD